MGSKEQIQDLQPEIERRVFDVDSEQLRSTLIGLGAQALGVRSMERAVFDFNPVSPGRWIRLRNEGDVTTLAIKERNPDGHDGEMQITVSDFTTTLQMLEMLGYKPRSIQENRRELYMLDTSEVSIDSWPQIGDVLEIEAPDEASLQRAAARLGIEPDTLTNLSIEQYYLDQLGIDVKTVPELRF